MVSYFDVKTLTKKKIFRKKLEADYFNFELKALFTFNKKKQFQKTSNKTSHNTAFTASYTLSRQKLKLSIQNDWERAKCKCIL